MSYDTNKNYAYMQQGKQLRLYKILKSSGRVVDNQGRVTGGDMDSIIYPDEAITNGLRIEYTALEKVFVTANPETTTDSSLSEDASPSESSYLNLNRVLSLAIVCFVKAQLAERMGDLQLKEYYMREFYKKVADNESNKNKMFIASPISTFAIK
jgi:hypothetical protein|tara:strand:- start:930 stop:1391 length:462 start_codon:yes stop_codon:yes gene_type:complete